MRTDKPKRLRVIWAPEAKAAVRAIDQENAMAILRCLDRYLLSREGDVKKLKPPYSDLRLRCGNYRLFFRYVNADTIHISDVRDRRDAYR